MAKATRDIVQAELERRNNDLVVVHNPTDKDHVVIWDRATSPRVWRIQAKKDEIVPRYIAMKYIREMLEKMRYEDLDKKTREENERRIKGGMTRMTPWEEQVRFEGRALTEFDSGADKLTAILYKGLYREYGIDPEVTKELAAEEKADKRTLTQRLTENLMATEQKVEPSEEALARLGGS
jgi:hypothetical protein